MKEMPMMRSQYDYDKAPKDMAHSLKGYIEFGQHPGDFLAAVFSNDLFEAFARADEINRYRMFDIVCWIYNYAPIACYGSQEIFNSYIENRKKEVEAWKVLNQS